MDISFNPIGIILTPHKNKEGMPIQAAGAVGAEGRVELNPEFKTGLQDLDGFSHIYLIYHFHKASGFELLVKPFLDRVKRGLFATRAPKRPNGIGISVVKLLKIDDNILYVQNVDMLNETPLLDIKPYIPEFDMHKVSSIGWYKDKTNKLNEIKSDDRFS
jgi:tRNA-Thr(GGU) m(6)t(6)A37 methyltransferase TsaA